MKDILMKTIIDEINLQANVNEMFAPHVYADGKTSISVDGRIDLSKLADAILRLNFCSECETQENRRT